MIKRKVGIYIGAFDPFHIGHLEAAKVALNYVSEVMIFPKRSGANYNDLFHRYNIIQLSIIDEKFINVSNEDISVLNDKLYKDNYLIGILESDKCKKKPKIKVHEWIIIPKCGYKTPLLKWSITTNYPPLSLFKERCHSSTQIRHNILCNNDPKSLLNKQALEYIKMNELYSLKSYVKEMITNYPTLINKEGLLTEQPKILVIKENLVNVDDVLFFKSFKDSERYQHEISSYKLSIRLLIPTPEYLLYRDNVIIMSYGGLNVIKAIEYGHQPYQIGYKIGEILKRCHKINIETLSASENKDLINHPIISTGSFDSKLVERYIKNPGKFGYCHGNALIKNFLVKDDTINMINFIGISKMGNRGIPAYDYYTFLKSVKDDGTEYGEEICSGFVNGYGKKHFTKEAKFLFK